MIMLFVVCLDTIDVASILCCLIASWIERWTGEIRTDLYWYLPTQVEDITHTPNIER